MNEVFKLWDSEEKKVLDVEAKKVGKEWKARCPNPNHNDKIFSLSINKEKEVYNCFGCPFEGHLYNPTQKLTDKPKKKAREQPIPINYKKMEERAQEYQGNIPQGIREARGLTDEIIEKFQLGFCQSHPIWPGHKKSITIPIKKDGKIVNIRYHSLIKDADPKILPYQEGLKYPTWLYPESQLDNDVLIVTEGELDALCCISQGLPAITRTCGALVWKPEFNQYFKHKIVHICQDCDKPGREGAEKIAQQLVKIAKEIRIINLGLPETKELKGQDLTDWFITHGKSKQELLKLIKKSLVYIGLSLARLGTLKEKEKPKKKPERIFITGRQLVEEKTPELPAPIGKGFLVPERYTILAASDGEGKTTFCTQLALSTITGTTFLDFFPIFKPVKVLYFCGENSRGDIKAKINFQKTEIEKILDRSIIEDLQDRLIIVEPININFWLDSKDKTELHNWLEEIKPEIVIFDPLADFIASNKSLSDDVLARTTAKTLTEIAQKYKCFPILTTHLKKEAINPNTGRSIVTPENVWTFVFGSRYWVASAAAQIVIIRADLQKYPKAKKLVFKFKTSEPIDVLQVIRNPNLFYEELPKDKMSLASLTAEDVKDVLEKRCKGEQVKSILIDVIRKDLGCGVTMARDLIDTALKTKLLYLDKKDNLIKITPVVGNKLFNK